MKNVGYIYVLINPSMPNLCKVGKTTREPNDRVREISSATGVPQSFIEIYSERVSNPDEAEKAVHYKLEACGFRVSANREFFQGSVSEIIKITSKILEKYKNENDSFDRLCCTNRMRHEFPPAPDGVMLQRRCEAVPCG